MPQHDDLFQLIHSLSPNEKRYFKLYANRHLIGKHKTNYVKLFDAMNQWPDAEYDEKLFLKKFRGKGFIKNFRAEKSHLFETIINALPTSNSKETKSAFQLLQEIDFLVKKDLVKVALKKIKTTIAILESREEFWAIIYLKELQLDLWYKNANYPKGYTPKIYEDDTNNVLERLMLHSQALQLDFHYTAIGDSNLHWNKHYESPFYDRLHNLLSNPQLSKLAWVKLAQSVQAHFLNQKKYNEGMAFSESLLAIIPSKFGYVRSVSLASIIGNCLTMAICCCKEDVFPLALKLYNELPLEGNLDTVIINLMKTYHYLVYMSGLAKYDDLTEEYMTEVAEYTLKTTKSVANWIKGQVIAMLIYIRFYRREYEKIISLINSLRMLEDKKGAFDFIFAIVLPIEFICHVNLRNHSLSESKFRSLKRFYRAHFQNNNIENLIRILSTIAKEGSLQTKSVKVAEKVFFEQPFNDHYDQLRGIIHFAITNEFTASFSYMKKHAN